ncbi:MAG: hypothetical protein KU37_09085 [Sulfuricurvum sp. PC08-66]|nr:MAG: hypothetical protein KU37_09085 [Sulfuricurvum sp. PC08-66]
MLKTFFALLLIALPLWALPKVVLLKSVGANNVMRFLDKSQPFYCYTAAINTHETFLDSNATSQACKTQMHLQLRRDPIMRYAYAYALHEEIAYTLEAYEGNSCFMWLDGGRTWSEYLLEKGYALLKNSHSEAFIKTTLYAKLQRAQERAKYEHRGVWSDETLAECFRWLP